MKTKEYSFSFLMELIIVIFFFTASATVCVSFIVQAKDKQVQGAKLQNSLIEAQSMIESMQAYPDNELEGLLGVKKINENTYQKGDIVIKLIKKEIIEGKIEIKNKDKIVIELPFVLGGNDHE